MSDEGVVDVWRVVTLDMAAFLAAKNHELVSTEVDGRDCFWFFEKNDGLLTDVMDFTQGDGLCEPMKLLESFKRMRREMFEKLDAQRTA